MPYCINLNDFDSARHRLVGGPWPDGCVNCGSSSSTSARSSSSRSSGASTTNISGGALAINAGLPEVNGQYCINGNINNTPLYSKLGTTINLYRWNGYWQFNPGGVSLNSTPTTAYYATTAGDNSGPPTGKVWTAITAPAAPNFELVPSPCGSSSSSSPSAPSTCLISNVTACVDGYSSPGVWSGTLRWDPISSGCPNYAAYTGYETQVFYELGAGSGSWGGWLAASLSESSVPLNVFSNAGQHRYRVRAVDRFIDPLVYTPWVESNAITQASGPFCSSSNSSTPSSSSTMYYCVRDKSSSSSAQPSSSSSSATFCGGCNDNLIANGDFEQVLQLPAGFTNGLLAVWTQSDIDVIGRFLWHPGVDANWFVDLSGSPGPGYIEQSFATTVGQQYRVTFKIQGNWYALRSTPRTGYVSAAGQQMDFTVNPASYTLPSWPPQTEAEMNWLDQEFVFTANSTTTTLKFASTMVPGYYGPVIDCVCVRLPGSSSSSSSSGCPALSVFADATISYNDNAPKYLNTGVYFNAGATIEATVTGSLTYNGPAAISEPGGPIKLKGMVRNSTDTYAPGNGAEFEITPVFSGTAPAAGYLYVAIFDSLYSDNTGGYTVAIRSCPRSSSSSSSETNTPDMFEYNCANGCTPTLAMVWPPVDPGHYTTQAECLSSCCAATATPSGANDVAYLVVAGGGAGGLYSGGGGGGGGVVSGMFTPAVGVSLVVAVGAGGSAGSNIPSLSPTNGNDSSLDAIVAYGGGIGGSCFGATPVASGGSGGGGDGQRNAAGGLGITDQGHPGGAGITELVGCGQAYQVASGGGGGAGAPGEDGILNVRGGNGGAGVEWNCNYYGGGGGAGGRYDPFSGTGNACDYAVGAGGLGGGGTGIAGGTPGPGNVGVANTGGGAGGGGVWGQVPYSWGAAGGSGVVILRTRLAATATTGSPTVTQDGLFYVYTFTGSGSITF